MIRTSLSSFTPYPSFLTHPFSPPPLVSPCVSATPMLLKDAERFSLLSRRYLTLTFSPDFLPPSLPSFFPSCGVSHVLSLAQLRPAKYALPLGFVRTAPR